MMAQPVVAFVYNHEFTSLNAFHSAAVERKEP
jgi:hypothetical protein